MFITATPPSIAATEIRMTVHSANSGGQYAHVAAGSGTTVPGQEFEVDSGSSTVDQRVIAQKIKFEWIDERTQKKFARLEAKVLAQKATDEDLELYQIMKQSRRAFVVAQVYVRNYAETERLKMLSKRLDEIQKYLKPIVLP